MRALYVPDAADATRHGFYPTLKESIMKLYYSPGACSMAPHITLREAGLTFDLEKVDLAQKKTARGDDYTQVNPKGYVPALMLDDGAILTEAGVIMQYVADQKPQSGLVPSAGTMERYRLMEWLNFISTEVHKQLGPFFKPNTPAEMKQILTTLLGTRFNYLVTSLGNKPYLTGDGFTVADAYLFTVLNWTTPLKIDIAKWPKLKEYLARVADRPKVRETMKAEGLVS